MPAIDPEHGPRLMAARRRCGMSRERLAGLAGLSVSIIKFIETRRRPMTLRVAQAVAPHLGVRDLGELFGPAVTLSLDPRSSHPHVELVRRALTAWHIGGVDGPASSPDYLEARVDAAWQTWHTSPRQRTEVGGILPDLIDVTQRAVQLHEGPDRRRANAMLAQAYHLAQAFLAWHGDRELCYLTVDRGMMAAQAADDPLAIAQATWYAAHLLRAVGRSDEALERLNEAMGLLSHEHASPDIRQTEMVADLHLCVALTKARSGDQSAWVDWDAARHLVANSLPAGFVGLRTRVSRPLVEVYAVMVAADLGEVDEGHKRARDLDPLKIPSTERRARHFVELARLADMEGAKESTVHLLSKAHAISPETVQFSPAARDIIGRLLSDAPASIRPDVTALASSTGLA